MAPSLSTKHQALNTDYLRRYARHIILPEIGEGGQGKLLDSSALVIGAGGFGSAALAYLAAGGVGHIGIVEPDRVELSNLQRQALFETGDIGRAKIDAAADRIHEINPECELTLFPRCLTEANACELVKNFDIVLDGSDNFKTRFALADACMKEKRPLVSAAISGFAGYFSTFKPYLGALYPCYRCLVPEPPEREITCEQEGVIGPLAGIMGSFQALEAIKELLGIGGSLSGRLLVMDALAMDIKIIALPRDPACLFCG
ncbi:MAG: HesA/MoeB/ThiF family protein [Pseudomonadota bacterium]|nr:HesA/MoeB/ThiF family protein [Pseudomonadota bacterium]